MLYEEETNFLVPLLMPKKNMILKVTNFYSRMLGIKPKENKSVLDECRLFDNTE
jgi:hypothetical protein